MITVIQARNILGELALNKTDEDIQMILNYLYKISEKIIDSVYNYN
jgi:hypothetical protein